jgi:hypothetical protein
MIHNHDRCHQHQLEPQWPDCNIRNDPRQKKHGPSARRGAGGCTNWDRWYRHAGESIARCPSYAVTRRMPQAAAASRSLKSARSLAIFPTEPPAQSIEILAYFLVQDSNCIERHSWIQRALRSMTDRFFGILQPCFGERSARATSAPGSLAALHRELISVQSRFSCRPIF